MPSDSPPSPDWRKAAITTQVATSMVAPVVLGLVLDWQFDWLPWATITGVALGFLLSLYHLTLLVKGFKKPDSQQSDRTDRSEP